MGFEFLHLIPDDILEIFIWPNISNNIKMLLNKDLYIKYHNEYYELNTKYLIFIIKNKIHIAINTIINNEKLVKYNKKIYYDNKVFINNYTFIKYLCKKYNNLNYINVLENINNKFTELSIKEYKNYIDKNILWIK